MGIKQQVILDPQNVDHNQVDPADEHLSDVIEQPVEQHVESTLRRSTRVRKSAIPSDYVVYLQEFDYDIRVKIDPEMFS